MEKLTRFERTRLISARSLQIALGAPIMVTYKKGMTPDYLAKLEIDGKVLPMAVLREFPDGVIKKVDGC